MRRRRAIACLSVTVLVAAVLGGCARKADVESLQSARALGQEERWAEAMPIVKQYVQTHPGGADGHYLLGMAHLYAEKMNVATGIAIGELQLALALHEKSGERGVLAESMTPKEFAVAVHRETAHAHIWWIQSAREAGLPVRFVVPRLHAALESVERALAIDPESERLRQIEERIHFYLDQYNGGKRPREDSRAAGPADADLTAKHQ